jgi:hypothetical protein
VPSGSTSKLKKPGDYRPTSRQFVSTLKRNGRRTHQVKKKVSPKRSWTRRVAPPSLFARIADLVSDDPEAPRDLSSNPRHLEKYGLNRSDPRAV